MDNPILKKRIEINLARVNMQKELMRDYDDNVYQPALAELMSECRKTKHSNGFLIPHYDGSKSIGICSACGGIMFENE